MSNPVTPRVDHAENDHYFGVKDAPEIGLPTIPASEILSHLNTEELARISQSSTNLRNLVLSTAVDSPAHTEYLCKNIVESLGFLEVTDSIIEKTWTKFYREIFPNNFENPSDEFVDYLYSFDYSKNYTDDERKVYQQLLVHNKKLILESLKELNISKDFLIGCIKDPFKRNNFKETILPFLILMEIMRMSYEEENTQDEKRVLPRPFDDTELAEQMVQEEIPIPNPKEADEGELIELVFQAFFPENEICLI